MSMRPQVSALGSYFSKDYAPTLFISIYRREVLILISDAFNPLFSPYVWTNWQISRAPRFEMAGKMAKSVFSVGLIPSSKNIVRNKARACLGCFIQVFPSIIVVHETTIGIAISSRREQARWSSPHLARPVIKTFQVTEFLTGISSNTCLASRKAPQAAYTFSKTVCT